MYIYNSILSPFYLIPVDIFFLLLLIYFNPRRGYLNY